MSFSGPKPHASLLPVSDGRAWKRFGLATLVLGLVFFRPLIDLIRLALASEANSHVLLVPLVSAYLVWTERRQLPAAGSPWFGLAGLSAIAATAALTTSLLPGVHLPADQRLSLRIVALALGIVACGAVFLGRDMVRHCVFPIAFLGFAIPMPGTAIDFFETTLQHASAEVAGWAFDLAGPPVIHDGLLFRLPGMSIKVAQECSGFRSTLVLFMISVLAARMFLRTPWKRALLVLTIFPLGILRNAFRIWTLATLSVNVNPDILDSWLHHRGGPVFFALSLVPLYLLLIGLHRTEQIQRTAPPSSTRPI